MSFTLRTTLFRYIQKKYKKSRGGLFIEAFVAAPGKPLSVNLIGVESKRNVARYYAKFLEGGGPSRVAVSSANLSKYNKAAKKAGVIIRHQSGSREWTCDNGGKNCAAYALTNHEKSPSHSHVEFVRYLNETDAKKFARAMARTGFVMART